MHKVIYLQRYLIPPSNATKNPGFASLCGYNGKKMISIGKIFSVALASVMVLASCQKDDTLHYSNITMGNFVDGVFVSDQGNRFNIKEQTCEGIPDTLKRAIITCDVLAKTGEDAYDIRLNGFSGVFTKEPVDSTAVTDSTVFAEDPLMIHEMWYSGGYINMYVLIPLKIGSGHAHLINLVRNDEASVPGVYEFTLKHNAFGEVATPGDMSYTLGGTYASFPAAGMFTEDEADIIIRWNAGKSDDTASETGSQSNFLVYKWKRGGYEHI